MKKLAPLSLALGLIVAGATAANADGWNRSGSTTGPDGNTASNSGSGYCSGGSCASSQHITGPRGNSATRSGSTSCSDGSCAGGATYTGPAGQQATRARSFTRY